MPPFSHTGSKRDEINDLESAKSLASLLAMATSLTMQSDVDFYIGFVAGVKAFTAAVLGGIGSLPGAMLGRPADRIDRSFPHDVFFGGIQGCGRVGRRVRWSGNR